MLMRLLLRVGGSWIALSLLGPLLLFWHAAYLYRVAPRQGGWHVTVVLSIALVLLAVLAISGAVGAYGLWTLREGGRRAAIAYLTTFLLLSVAAAAQWGLSGASVAALLSYGAPMGVLLSSRARATCAA